jgi:hypothetical protein
MNSAARGPGDLNYSDDLEIIVDQDVDGVPGFSGPRTSVTLHEFLSRAVSANLVQPFTFCGPAGSSGYTHQIRLAQTLTDYVNRIRQQLEGCVSFEGVLNNGLLVCTDAIHAETAHNFLPFDELVSVATRPADSRTPPSEHPDQSADADPLGLLPTAFANPGLIDYLSHRPRSRGVQQFSMEDARSAMPPFTRADYDQMIVAVQAVQAGGPSAAPPAASSEPSDESAGTPSSPRPGKRSRPGSGISDTNPGRKRARARDGDSRRLLDAVRENVRVHGVNDEELEATAQALESYRTALCNKTAHTRVFFEYKEQLLQRLRDTERLRDTFVELARCTYQRILADQIRKSKICILADQRRNRDCFICLDEGPTCGISVKECSCGPVGHMSCILNMCWNDRLSGKTAFSCPSCRAKFSETHIKKVFFQDAGGSGGTDEAATGGTEGSVV